jgi:hypothetical protein
MASVRESASISSTTRVLRVPAGLQHGGHLVEYGDRMRYRHHADDLEPVAAEELPADGDDREQHHEPVDDAHAVDPAWHRRVRLCVHLSILNQISTHRRPDSDQTAI